MQRKGMGTVGKNGDVIAIYSRKSRFTGQGESIGNQVDLCRDYIRTAFGEAYAQRARVFEDEGFSGGNLNRPGFQRMMEGVRGGEFRGVVVYRLDRISRSIGDFSALIAELGRLEVDFISIRERFDTASPMGRAMMYIASVFSQLERETIAERIRDNMHELAKTGRWLGGTTPTGYTSESVRRVTVDGKGKKACRLKLIPQEAEVVRTIYRLYRQSGSLAQTEAELLRAGVRTKTGREFTRFSIKAILQNPVYLIADGEAYRYFARKQAELFSGPEEFDGVRGVLAYNRTRQEKGHTTRFLPPSQWIVAVGQHPGIIPSRVWIEVQLALERGSGGVHRGARGNEALLTGLLRCRCGGRMYPKVTKRTTEQGRPVYTYVCKRKERSKGSLCSGVNANGNELDRAVLEEIGGLEEDREQFSAQLEKLWREGGAGEEPSHKALEELRQQRARLRRKIDALIDTLADFDGSTAAGHVKERVEELHARDGELEEQMARLEQDVRRSALRPETLVRMGRRLAGLREGLEGLTVEQKRTVVRAVVRDVVWEGPQVHVVLLGAEEMPLPEEAEKPNALCEDSKCYTIAAEQSAIEVAERVSFEAKWRLLAQVEFRCYILISNVSGAVKVAPLQILQFPVVLPHKFQDAEKFNLRFSDFSEITETADKLRWLRYQRGLRQRDVADYAGIDRSTYVHYEEYGKDFYSPEHMERIAQLFEVPIESLLDDYNLFLRNGQGEQIKAIRVKLGLTQREYADKLGISLGNLKQWEQNRKQIFKSTWEKYFKQGLESCE